MDVQPFLAPGVAGVACSNRLLVAGGNRGLSASGIVERAVTIGTAHRTRICLSQVQATQILIELSRRDGHPSHPRLDVLLETSLLLGREDLIQLGVARRTLGILTVLQERRNRNGHNQTNNGQHNHDLNQCKTLLHCILSFSLSSLSEGALWNRSFGPYPAGVAQQLSAQQQRSLHANSDN